MLNKAFFKFIGNINDFLEEENKFKKIEYLFNNPPSLKDAIEALGVPHTEVSHIKMDGKSADFSERLTDKQEVEVYSLEKCRDKGLETFKYKPELIRFIVDENVSKLSKYLRMMGFDSLIYYGISDKEIVDIAFEQERIILSRDIGLLKRKKAIYGYWLRSTKINEQILEIFQRYELISMIKPFSLCLVCNQNIYPVKKERIIHLLEKGTIKDYEEFYQCSDCEKVYWKGSHYQNMIENIAKFFAIKP